MFPLGLAPLAARQLAAWEELAHDWTGYLDEDEVVRCASCHIGLWRIRDDHGTQYQYTDEQLLALKVAHLRQAHMELDPDR